MAWKLFGFSRLVTNAAGFGCSAPGGHPPEGNLHRRASGVWGLGFKALWL